MKRLYSYEIDNTGPEARKRFIRDMFSSIAPTYDLLNHVLSMGTDILWRNHIFNHIRDVRGARAIDLCCGTGDLSLIFHKRGARVFSLDFSMNMLRRGVEKKSLRGPAVAADGLAMITISQAPSKLCHWWRTTSRSHRLTRFRITAFPTLRLTVMP